MAEIEVRVADYSSGFPGALALAEAGFVGAVRYIGYPTNPKCTTRSELEDFSRHGLGMALVYEHDTGDWRGGWDAGRYAATLGRQHADQIGFPAGRPIYMAVDTDVVTAAEFGLVAQYLDGAASVLGWGNTGVYGEFDVIERMVPDHAAFGWQAAAWSSGLLNHKAVLYQRIGSTFVNGVACDINVVLDQRPDWGQYNYQQEDDMPLANDERAAIFEILNQLTGSHVVGEYPGWPGVDGQSRTVVDITRRVHERLELAVIAGMYLGGPSTPEGKSMFALLAELTGREPADVDEPALAALLAADLATLLAESVKRTSDEQLAALAKNVNDEHDRRQRARAEAEVPAP